MLKVIILNILWYYLTNIMVVNDLKYGYLQNIVYMCNYYFPDKIIHIYVYSAVNLLETQIKHK